jgi:hypothetical protein
MYNRRRTNAKRLVSATLNCRSRCPVCHSIRLLDTAATARRMVARLQARVAWIHHRHMFARLEPPLCSAEPYSPLGWRRPMDRPRPQRATAQSGGRGFRCGTKADASEAQALNLCWLPCDQNLRGWHRAGRATHAASQPRFAWAAGRGAASPVFSILKVGRARPVRT